MKYHPHEAGIQQGLFFGLQMGSCCRTFISQPYDPKRSCWVPMKDGGFAEGTIEKAEGDKVPSKEMG